MHCIGNYRHHTQHKVAPRNLDQAIIAVAIRSFVLIGHLLTPPKRQINAEAGEDAVAWSHNSCQNSRGGMAGRHGNADNRSAHQGDL